MKKKTNSQSVAIILPSYNSSNTISASINSILNQTYTNWKLIIVDDGSDEITKNIFFKNFFCNFFYNFLFRF